MVRKLLCKMSTHFQCISVMKKVAGKKVISNDTLRYFFSDSNSQPEGDLSMAKFGSDYIYFVSSSFLTRKVAVERVVIRDVICSLSCTHRPIRGLATAGLIVGCTSMNPQRIHDITRTRCVSQYLCAAPYERGLNVSDHRCEPPRFGEATIWHRLSRR